jgi:hypothetical protein
MSYNNYLKSTHWKRTKEAFFQNRTKKCFLCHNKKDIVVHHKRYSTIGFERKNDLRYLCQNCHNKIHKYHLEDCLSKYPLPKRRLLRDFLKALK